jgi:uncharacterized protein (TIGR02270 family)
MQALIERQAEDAGFLWRLRRHQVRAPNVRLTTLVRLDERLDAHLDALVVAGNAGVLAAQEQYDMDPGTGVFLAVALSLARDQASSRTANNGGEPSIALLPPPAVLDAESVVDAFISALALAERDPALGTIEQFVFESNPLERAIAAGAIGARRSDPKLALAVLLSDGSPLVRARAYRSAGQLGRAEHMAKLRPGLTEPDPECRFWSAWAAARMGGGEVPLGVLAEIAWTNQPRAGPAFDALLRLLEVPHANAWLREFAKLPDRRRDLIRGTGTIGDPVYIPWLIEHMADPETARLAGEAFSMITGLDLGYRDLDRKRPNDFDSGPNDDPADENVALDEDDNLAWPDPGRIGSWWQANRGNYQAGAAYFLGTPKRATDWLAALSDAFQRQRCAAALELAIRMPQAAMFEVRARGRLQRRLIVRSRGPS